MVFFPFVFCTAKPTSWHDTTLHSAHWRERMPFRDPDKWAHMVQQGRMQGPVPESGLVCPEGWTYSQNLIEKKEFEEINLPLNELRAIPAIRAMHTHCKVLVRTKQFLRILLWDWSQVNYDNLHLLTSLCLSKLPWRHTSNVCGRLGSLGISSEQS